MTNDISQILWKGVVHVFSDGTFLSLLGTIAAIIWVPILRILKDYLVALMQKFITKQQKHHQISQSYIVETDFIKEKLCDLRDKMVAARAAIFQFRNGNKFMLSKPEFKISCTYEELSAGVMPCMDDIQAVIVNGWLDFVAPTIKPDRPTKGVTVLTNPEDKNAVLLYDTENMEISHYKLSATKHGIADMIATPLYAKGNKPIGILAVQYLEGQHALCGDVQLEVMQSTAKDIQFVLDESK